MNAKERMILLIGKVNKLARKWKKIYVCHHEAGYLLDMDRDYTPYFTPLPPTSEVPPPPSNMQR